MKAFSIGVSAIATAASANKAAVQLWNGNATPCRVDLIIGCVFPGSANEEFFHVQRTSVEGTVGTTTALAAGNLWTVDTTFTLTALTIDTNLGGGEPTKNAAILAAKLQNSNAWTGADNIIDFVFCGGLWIPPSSGVCINSGNSQGISAGRWNFYGAV